MKRGKKQDKDLKKTAASILQCFAEDPDFSLMNLESRMIREEGFEARDASLLVKALAEKINKKGFFPITHLEIFITEDCNQTCDYCFVEGKNRQHAMDIKTGRRAIDFLLDHARKEKELSAVFMGGEPLLAFDVLKEIVLYGEKKAAARNKVIHFSMTSNGTLFSRDKARFCHDHAVKYLISIDGDWSTHNLHRITPRGRSSFERLLPNIPHLKRYQPWMGARVTLHHDTVEKMSDNVRFLWGLGFNQIIIGPATGIPWSKKALATYKKELLKTYAFYKKMRKKKEQFRMTFFEKTEEDYFGQKKHWGCRAGRAAVVINSKGEIFPCSKMLGVENLEGVYKLGDLEHGLTEIGRRARLVGNFPGAREKCLDCECVDFCYGGCYPVNFQATGDIFAPSGTDCEIVKIQHEVLLKVFQDRKQEESQKG